MPNRLPAESKPQKLLTSDDAVASDGENLAYGWSVNAR